LPLPCESVGAAVPRDWTAETPNVPEFFGGAGWRQMGVAKPTFRYKSIIEEHIG
jgi:hypothetical protein